MFDVFVVNRIFKIYIMEEDQDKGDNLFKICQQGDTERLKKILEKKSLIDDFDINAKFENGSTCLHEVATRTAQFTDIVKLLLENGASANAQDDDGSTPLHGAVLYHCVDNIKEIMKYNPDVNITNLDNVSPVNFARNLGDTEIERLLTGTVISEKKNKKSRTNRRIAKSVKGKINSYLPSTPIMSPSILKKKRKRSEDDSLTDGLTTTSPSSKRVRFNVINKSGNIC